MAETRPRCIKELIYFIWLLWGESGIIWWPLKGWMPRGGSFTPPNVYLTIFSNVFRSVVRYRLYGNFDAIASVWLMEYFVIISVLPFFFHIQCLPLCRLKISSIHASVMKMIFCISISTQLWTKKNNVTFYRAIMNRPTRKHVIFSRVNLPST